MSEHVYTFPPCPLLTNGACGDVADNCTVLRGNDCLLLLLLPLLLLLLHSQVALELLPICPMHQQRKPQLMQRLEQERAAAVAAGGVAAAVRLGITGCA
jgi:hypothetical protein